MEYSIYNTTIKLNSKYFLVYNSFSDRFLIVNHSDNLLLEKFSVDELKEEYYSIYRQLEQVSGIIHNQDEQINVLLNRYTSIIEDNKHYTLKINPTLDCNCQCWYCYEKHISKSEMNFKTQEAVLKLIGNIISENTSDLEKFTISFFGGEPLMKINSVIIPILEYFSTVCKANNIQQYIHFTSNGILLNNQLIARLKALNVNSFQITLDGDRNRHNMIRYLKYSKTGSYDKIIANIKKLLSSKIEVILRINITGQNVLFLNDITSDLSDLSSIDKQFLSIDFQQVWQDNSCDIRHEINCIREHFNTLGFRTSFYIEDLSNNLTPCYADYVNEALINYNGDVFKCTARDFTESNRNGYLLDSGQISWRNNPNEALKVIGYKTQHCKMCRIFPICGGGCSQKILESTRNETCLMGLNDDDKTDIILTRFNRRFLTI